MYIAIRVGQLQNRCGRDLENAPPPQSSSSPSSDISKLICLSKERINERQVQTLVVYFLTDNKCTRGKCFAPTF